MVAENNCKNSLKAEMKMNWSNFGWTLVKRLRVEESCGWVVWSGHNWNSANIEKGNSITYGQMEIWGENRSGQIFSYCSFPPYWIDNDNGWYLILKFFTFLPYTDILSLNRTDVFSFNLKNQFPSKFQWSFSKWQSRVFPLLPKIVLCKYSE